MLLKFVVEKKFSCNPISGFDILLNSGLKSKYGFHFLDAMLICSRFCWFFIRSCKGFTTLFRLKFLFDLAFPSSLRRALVGLKIS